MLRNRRALNLERLDDRIVPAIAVRLNTAGVLTVSGNPVNTLTITQTANNVLNVKDGSVNYGTYSAPGGFNATLTRFNQGVLFDTGNFTYTGNVTLDLGLGSLNPGLREVSIFDGSLGGPLGTIAANVTVRNGNGSEYISIGRPQIATGTVDIPVQVNGNVQVTTRSSAGPDTFELVPGAIVQSNIYLTNVDIVTIGFFDPPPATPSLAFVGGNIIASNPAPAGAFTFDTYATIGGNVVVTSTAGSFANALVTINDGTTIGGNLTASLANGTDILTLGSSQPGVPAPVISGDVNFVTGVGNDFVFMIDDFSDGDNAQILGNFSATLGQGDNQIFFDQAALVTGNVAISAGNGVNAAKGALSTYFAGTVIGNLNITFGNGNNNIDFGGQVFGNSVLFQTGGGNDVVTIEASAFAPAAKLSIYTGAGNDTVNINSVNFLVGYIDGGFGAADDFNTTVVIPITWTLVGFEL
ncbi:MAG: hypothetical protein K1X57_13810 [Gemmataceae bacterium]|nr:hypothetical protein [Gemmataceae bacterium]